MTRDFNINTPDGVVSVQLSSGEVLFLAGPNGTGKSSLLYELGRSAGEEGEIFPGHRQISFNSDDVDQIGQSIATFKHQLLTNVAIVNRASNPWGEQHIKSVVRRFINLHNQDQNDLVIRSAEEELPVSQIKLDRLLMLPTLNNIFQNANMSVQFVLLDGLLKATRGGEPYGIDHLSDGERAALLIICGCLVQSTGALVAIDEPERNLHPGIAGPLISSLVRVKSDIFYIFASHDLDLIDSLQPKEIIHVRNSTVLIRMSRTTQQVESRQYEITNISKSGLDDDLRKSVLGSRRRLLLVEGTITSDDLALYGNIYEGWRVTARGGCDEVVRSVKALRQNSNLAWLEVRGIIDRDGRDDLESQSLKGDGIDVLACPTIENAFLDPEIALLMAGALAELKGGSAASDRMLTVRKAIQALATQHFDEVVARRVQWAINRRISASKISVTEVLAGCETIPAIDISPVRQAEQAAVRALIEKMEPDELIRRLPIKNTKMPNRICEALGYDDFADYKRSILRQMESATPLGGQLKGAMRNILPGLG